MSDMMMVNNEEEDMINNEEEEMIIQKMENAIAFENEKDNEEEDLDYGMTTTSDYDEDYDVDNNSNDYDDTFDADNLLEKNLEKVNIVEEKILDDEGDEGYDIILADSEGGEEEYWEQTHEIAYDNLNSQEDSNTEEAEEEEDTTVIATFDLEGEDVIDSDDNKNSVDDIDDNNNDSGLKYFKLDSEDVMMDEEVEMQNNVDSYETVGEDEYLESDDQEGDEFIDSFDLDDYDDQNNNSNEFSSSSTFTIDIEDSACTEVRTAEKECFLNNQCQNCLSVR